MTKNIFIILCCLLNVPAICQEHISGRVYDIAGQKEDYIPGTKVYWNGLESEGVVTDGNGRFTIPVTGTLPRSLVINFPGYQSDTITITTLSTNLKIRITKLVELGEVKISAKRDAVAISTINPINAERLTSTELLKAACCNLSEAFETNPSVNVAYKDAVTGVKEIQLLGLGGTYVQMMGENIPDLRGLAGIYGLTFIPGPWIESIQVSKGSGSVINGYESTTGQINVEYKKPSDNDQPRYYLNLFSDENAGLEANAIFRKQVSPYWSTMLFMHGRSMKNEVDRNGDGFMDIPNNTSLNIFNRWQYHNTKSLEGQIGVKFLSDDIRGGQTRSVNAPTRYRTFVNTNRAEVSGKLGFIFPEKPFKSIGNIVHAAYHDMNSGFGLKTYNAIEKSLYVQSIYQNILWKSNHRYRVGINYRYNLLQQHIAGLPVNIEENIPGIFVEYTYSHLDKLTVIIGGRADLQEKKMEFIPRVHGKYNFTEDFIFRFSGGKSYRRPYLIADHLSVLASSRALIFSDNINPERAWNYGVNFTKRFQISGHEVTVSADAYRTEFSSQLIVDTYSDSSLIQFYNLNGKSFSNSFQITFNIELLEQLNLRLAHKIDDVRSTYKGVLREQPLIARHRSLGSLSYISANEHWKFDYTIVLEGRKKLQNIPTVYENGKDNYSPSFSTMNFQVTKVFRRFELYGGGENLLDFRQKNPIIDAENPFGNSFDATNIWGPIEGRRIYAGLRLSIR